MKIKNLFIVLAVLLLAGCSTMMNAKERSEALYKQQMADRVGCTSGNSCLGDVLSSSADLKNIKTKMAHNKEHKKVDKSIQAIKDCVAENQVQIEHGFPPKRNCSEFAAKQGEKTAGVGVGNDERGRVGIRSRFYPYSDPYRSIYPTNRYKYYYYPRNYIYGNRYRYRSH